jgi:hypothetical protein
MMTRHAPPPADKPRAAAETPAAGQSEKAKAKAKAEAEVEQRKKSRGTACKAAMEYLAASCDTYKTNNNTYPLTTDYLTQADPHAAEIVGDATLWLQYGAPVIDPFFDKRFILSASCADGMKYEYNSETGQVTTTR